MEKTKGKQINHKWARPKTWKECAVAENMEGSGAIRATHCSRMRSTNNQCRRLARPTRTREKMAQQATIARSAL